MAQSKEEKNRKQRERDAVLKAAGLSRSERRSVRKTVQKNPGILDMIGDAVKDAGKFIVQAAETVTDVIDGKPTKKNVSRGTKPRKTTTSKKTGKRIPTFEEFVKKLVAEDPKISQNKIKKQYRAKGGTVANKKAAETVRDVAERGRDRTKVTPVSYTHLTLPTILLV